MQVKVSARHGHLQEATQKEIQEKVERLLHFFDRITMIEVTVDLQNKLSKNVEIKVNAEHKHDFVAQDEKEELFAALDAAMDRIKHQITKYKEKIQNHRRDSGHVES